MHGWQHKLDIKFRNAFTKLHASYMHILLPPAEITFLILLQMEMPSKFYIFIITEIYLYVQWKLPFFVMNTSHFGNLLLTRSCTIFEHPASE